jgi:hypothetical protein
MLDGRQIENRLLAAEVKPTCGPLRGVGGGIEEVCECCHLERLCRRYISEGRLLMPEAG